MAASLTEERNIAVPNGLTQLLQDFTVAVLRGQPNNLLTFAKQYFCQRVENESNPDLEATQSSDESDTMEPPAELLSSHRHSLRRHSVAAERYDPSENDDEDKVTHPKSEQQREQLAESVQSIFLFRALDEHQASHVIDAMQERKITAGEIVIKEGDEDADYFYVVEKGAYEVKVQGQIVKTFEDNGSFGELALMYNTPRAAQIKALSDGILWALDRQSFRRTVLKSAYLKRRMYEEFINSLPMMKELNNYERMNVCDALKSQNFIDGQKIIQEGDPADCMYFVEEGGVTAYRKNESGQTRQVRALGRGDYFGELGLISKRPRAADVYSNGSTRCAVLDLMAFERLLGPCMDIMKRNQAGYDEDTRKAFASASLLDVNELLEPQ